MTSFVLGIDVGTSYTAAAIGRRRADGSVDVEPLELGSRKAAVPTVVYLGDDGGVVVGEAAERRAIDQPDRVVREFKRRIGDETPIIVGDLSVAAEDIYAVLAQWVVERAEEHEGEAPAVIAVSHPASWGEHRLGLVRAALAGVGLGDVELVSEPEAAGLHYLDQREGRDRRGDRRLRPRRRHVRRRTAQEAGRRLPRDRHPVGHRAPRRRGLRPTDLRAREVARGSQPSTHVDERQPDEALALARVRRDCVDAKEALSFDAETVVPVLLPGAQTRVRLVRSEFEQMIGDDLRRTVETLRQAVTAAGLELDDLTTVLLIGGSSRIPAVAQLISVELELPVAIDADPKASISLGAAVGRITSARAARARRRARRRPGRCGAGGRRRSCRIRRRPGRGRRSGRRPASHVDRTARDRARGCRRRAPRRPHPDHAARHGHPGEVGGRSGRHDRRTERGAGRRVRDRRRTARRTAGRPGLPHG